MADLLPLTVGTAGHIDHGKTILVEALSGKNTDRLAEERRRGISIELGFASLELPDGRNLSVIDVPGHDRLVRTMVSGATGVDLFLLVVAVDDGVMPQTREHLAVLHALGIEQGVVALTKCDLADEDVIELAGYEVRELLPEIPMVAVSARAASGLEELRGALADAADQVELERRIAPRTVAAEPAILHVDRAFSLHGIGTVVTGTLRGASIGEGDHIRLVSRGIEARVRAVHVHNQPVSSAMPGQRVALNLAGVSRREVSRGDVVAALDSRCVPSYRLDVELDLEAVAGNLDRERVQVHHGTRDAPARVVYLDQPGRFAQLRLYSPLVAAVGDRVVIRRIAPPDTLGGGTVVDPVAARHGAGEAAERLRVICDGSPREVLSLALGEGPVPSEPDRWVDCSALAPALRRHSRDQWESAVRALRGAGALSVRDGAMVAPSTEPPPASPSQDGPPILDDREVAALEILRADGASPRSPKALGEALGIERDEAVTVLNRLARTGSARCVRPGLYYEAAELQQLRERVVAVAAERQGSISLAELRDALATSRKYAQALLEHLDAEKVTIRRGERHHLRREIRAKLE